MENVLSSLSTLILSVFYVARLSLWLLTGSPLFIFANLSVLKAFWLLSTRRLAHREIPLSESGRTKLRPGHADLWLILFWGFPSIKWAGCLAKRMCLA